MSIDDEQQTTVVPDATPTEHVALAWSDDDDEALFADDEPGYLWAFPARVWCDAGCSAPGCCDRGVENPVVPG